MKTILSTILLALVFSTTTFAQKPVVENKSHERLITHVEGNIYDVRFLDENDVVLQKGQYWRNGNSLLPHGTWILFAQNSDKVVTKSKFEKGQQLFVETVIDGEVIRVNKQQLAAKNK